MTGMKQYYKLLRQAIDDFNVQEEWAEEETVKLNDKFKQADTAELVMQLQKDEANELELEGPQAWYSYMLGAKTTLLMLQLQHDDKFGKAKKELFGRLGF